MAATICSGIGRFIAQAILSAAGVITTGGLLVRPATIPHHQDYRNESHPHHDPSLTSGEFALS